LVSHVQGCIDPNAEERKTVLLWQLVDRVKCIEAQLQEWTDWAQQKVMQAARRLSKDNNELKALRQERDEYIRLKKEKEALEESTMKKLAEMENALRKAMSQVDRANSTAWRLEAENAEVRAEKEAAKLAAVVSVSECQEAAKREKKSTSKSQGWEKQKLKLQEDLRDGKGTLSQLLEQFAQAKSQLHQTEVSF
jgi:chromosome segregation ATPase